MLPCGHPRFDWPLPWAARSMSRVRRRSWSDRDVDIAIFGLGYVGAVSAACLAELGHQVIGVDPIQSKVDGLLAGEAPVVEPGLDSLLAAQIDAQRLSATTDGVAAASESDIIMLAVGTPSNRAGGVEAQHLLVAARDIGKGLAASDRPYVSVLTRSTSLPSVHQDVIAVIEAVSGRELGVSFGYACHPEFLREASAVQDFFAPPMIVIGSDEPRTIEHCEGLYPGIDAEWIVTGMVEAAMVKYASNAFHALKVAFANEIGLLTDQLGGDSREVMRIFMADQKLNISQAYLRPGNPFGGSCLPKDVRAMADLARREALSIPVIAGTLTSNSFQIERLVDLVLEAESDAVTILGLSFKEGTDDLREAPMVELAETLLGKGIDLRIFDQGLEMERLVGANARYALEALPHLERLLRGTFDDALLGTDVVVINHRRAAETALAQLQAHPGRIIDLVGVESLADHPGYRGLFW